MERSERAALLFNEGFNCAQAVLGAFGPGLGLDRELALKVAGPFGGGMGRTGGTCGAVAGGLMALGLKFGPTRTGDEGAKERAYGLVREFFEEFEARNGSVLCKQLLGCDLSAPEGQKRAREAGLHSSLCPKFVRDAAEILEWLLELE
ncbi:MAG: C-GCAxxG-C-C family protein [Candidatus Acetothermia bacterium]|jgi:C_GCAxxG_C_C family probable redox protein|nr:C-GCAxxG-C-C family protein [Candidatus Acetothermia bacterium]MDH7505676.1 C-GCAxxG-C-C family protein [Candidatus Acetothermia bacterium]